MTRVKSKQQAAQRLTMNPDDLVQLLQKGFRVSLGATTALVESVQDPQKRDENWQKMQTDFGQLTEEWAEKGAETEQEARTFVDRLVSGQGDRQPSDTGRDSSYAQAPTTTSATDSETELELQELTAQIKALRSELEKLRQDNPNV